jgi:hypothetical protein
MVWGAPGRLIKIGRLELHTGSVGLDLISRVQVESNDPK